MIAVDINDVVELHDAGLRVLEEGLGPIFAHPRPPAPSSSALIFGEPIYIFTSAGHRRL
jgi:hypothetical protein